jgi:TonB C terminal
MTRARANNIDLTTGSGGPRLGIILSVIFHALVIAGLALLSFQNPTSSDIIAAGEGEGGEGGGGAIEVGVADASAILGFAKPQEVSFPGDTDDPLNNMRLESIPREDEAPDEVLPKTERETDPTALKTQQPVANQQERIFTGKDERGRSDSDSIQQGRSYGSPSPADFRGGVAFGSGSGFGAGTGLPGGSAYGRLIQGIFSRNYNVQLDTPSDKHFVVVNLVIARSGAIIDSNITKSSPLNLVNRAVQRAIISSNPLPPVPAEFRPGVGSFTTTLYFQYPK